MGDKPGKTGTFYQQERPVNPQEVTISLPVETLNACLAALVKMPYEFANPHITLIQQRGAAALAEQQQPLFSEGGTTD